MSLAVIDRRFHSLAPPPSPSPETQLTHLSFTPTCHSQVPGYIEIYEQFKGKGVNEIYIVSVNDLFVVNAWKKDLLSQAGLEPNESVKFGEYSGGFAGQLATGSECSCRCRPST